MKLMQKIPFIGCMSVCCVYLFIGFYFENRQTRLDQLVMESQETERRSLPTSRAKNYPVSNIDLHVNRNFERQPPLMQPIKDRKVTLSLNDYNISANLDISLAMKGRGTVDKLEQVYKDLNQTKSESVFPAFEIRKYLMLNSKICQDVPSIDVIIIVHTRPENFKQRKRMRETFADKSMFVPFQVRIAFLLGKPKGSNLGVTLGLNSEHIKHKDTIMGDFYDDYHNLTLKGVMGFHWVSQYCSNSRFVLKIDDDVVVDMFNLLTRFMDHLKGKTRSIFCNIWKKHQMLILREGKWKVPNNVFLNKKFFPYCYCSGFTVILTSDLMRPMFEAAKITPFFWIDDVYLFGMLPMIAGNVTYHNYALGRNITLYEADAIDCWNKHGHECSILSFIITSLTPWTSWERIKKIHGRSWQAESIFEA